MRKPWYDHRRHPRKTRHRTKEQRQINHAEKMARLARKNKGPMVYRLR